MYIVRRKMLDLVLSGSRNVGDCQQDSATWSAKEHGLGSSHGCQDNI